MTVAAMVLFGKSALAGFGAPWPAPDCTDTNDGRCTNVGYFSGLSPFPDYSYPNNVSDVLPNTYNYTDPKSGAGGTWSFPGPGSPYYSVDGMAPGVAAGNFEAFINSYLNAPNPGGCVLSQPNPSADMAANNGTNPNTGCWAWRREKLGAAFLVLTMLGGKYDAYPGSAGPPATGPPFVFGNNVLTGVNDAIAAFGLWAQEVTQADADGYVDWDAQRNFPSGDPDTTSEDYGHDVATFRNTIGQTNMFIVFSNPGGGQYNLNRSCGNTWGAFTPVNVPLGYQMKLTANALNNQVAPGQTGTIDLGLHNTGPNPTVSGTLQVQLPGGSDVVQPCMASCADPNQPPLTFGTTARGYRTVGSGIPGVNGPDWYWDTGPFPVSANSTGSLTFNVPPNAPPGNLTFTIYYSPADQNGTVISTTVTFQILPIRYPSVVGLNSDVNAGGGLCGGALSDGSVIAHPMADSYGEYVDSAAGTGTINNFPPGGSEALNLGLHGGYAQVCREDLFQEAQDYMASGGSYTPHGAGTYDIGSWGGVNYISGNSYICGTINALTTIVQLSGTLHIGGGGCPTNTLDLTNASFAAGQLPSLGIIASGDIVIEAPVTHIDVYLFADGAIDTCDTSSGGNCDNILTVNGFLMAQNIAFQRLGPLGSTGSQLGEQISLNPQIYLNPPPLFTSAADNIVLQGQGERSPLF
jgi:hypothetical protein